MNKNKTYTDSEGMENYMAFYNQEITMDDCDPITLEQINKSKHPREIMSVLLNYRVLKFYYTKSIIELFEKGDGIDPHLRKKFPKIVEERARLYYDCMVKYPNLKKDEVNTAFINKIYKKWIENPDDDLLASAILQPSDIIKYFERYSGKGSLENRKFAEKALNEKNTWLLRYSSVKGEDDKINHAYVLSKYVKPNEYLHFLIIHRIGSGFYFGVSGILSGCKKIPENLNAKKIYPSIIELLKNEVL